MPEYQFGTFALGQKSPFHFKAGIYLIRNTRSGKVYVGSAVYLYGRMRHHARRLELGLHRNTHIQSAWNKDGPISFSFAALLYCAPEHLIFFEQRAIDSFLESAGRRSLYNLDLVAGSALGRHHSEETKAKIKVGRTGIPHSEETKAGYREARKGTRPPELCFIRSREATKGKSQSAEHVAKRAAANTGKKRTAEQNAKMSAAKMGIGKGRSLSPEQKAKLRAANLGRKLSEEHKAKLSAARKGKKFPGMTSKRGIRLSPEHRAKISAGNMGRVVSAETIAKIKATKLSRKQSSKNAQGRLFL